MQEKCIELWDLLGFQASNSKYFAATEQFVKDALTREMSTGRMAADHSRHLGWESIDCGIFTLKSMCLIRNGLRLSREAYTQGNLTLRRTRKRLAARIWEMGVNSGAARWSSQ